MSDDKKPKDTTKDEGEPKMNPNYRGKRENFDPNFKSAKKGGKPKAPPKKQSGPTAKTLPGPSNSSAMKNPTPTRDEPIWKESIFGPEIAVREQNSRTTFTPSCAAFIAVVNDMWSKFREKESNIDKTMLVEAVRYYSVAMLWMRIIALKRANSFTLTDQEEQLLASIETTTFNVPEPVFLYIKTFGNIETSSTGQNLIPQFPDLPITAIAGHGGYYGAIGAETHNQYEEIPCLGVAAEGLRASLGEQANGRYPSVLDQGNAENQNQVLINSNTLGFEPLTYRRNEAKNAFIGAGITDNVMPEDIPNTAFNYATLQIVNGWLSSTKTFKQQQVNFTTLGKNGAQSQTIIQRPIPTQGIRNINGEITNTSLFRGSTNEYGMSYYVLSQMMKTTAPEGNQQNLSTRAQVWSCVNFTGANAATTIPQAWIDNCNVRRNLPIEYQSERFNSISQKVSDWRLRTINLMEQSS